ncbi:hypothetical protein GAU_3651 [Gemmatimonas aurantiaca T-27]|uniref:DUF1080 domain-containing protein n=2 Tax=Gemmatimonas aurantiaca TaxID=173480 RepID=C1ADW6_GEMAT|nr:hypothetical protein GAU_3651 [Gemmatimonas aurantiaca T-27]
MPQSGIHRTPCERRSRHIAGRAAGRATPMRRGAFAVLAAALFAAPVLPALEDDQKHAASGTKPRPQPQASHLAGAVGHWADTTIGTPGIVVNGERWSGQTDPGALRRVSTQLFGSANDSFVKNGTAAGAFPFAVHTTTASFANGTLRAQFNMIGGKSDQVAGILFGLSPQGEYYAARYNTKEGNLAIWGFANGERRVVARGNVKTQLPLNTWHTLQVTVAGKTVRVSLASDSTLSVTHTFDTAPTGRVGVWVKRDAITAFRAFDVLARP